MKQPNSLMSKLISVGKVTWSKCEAAMISMGVVNEMVYVVVMPT
jgi:hypothetical protein